MISAHTTFQSISVSIHWSGVYINCNSDRIYYEKSFQQVHVSSNMHQGEKELFFFFFFFFFCPHGDIKFGSKLAGIFLTLFNDGKHFYKNKLFTLF